jgi:hypothetical protein
MPVTIYLLQSSNKMRSNHVYKYRNRTVTYQNIKTHDVQ